MSEMVERVARALWEKHRDDKLALIREGKISASMSGIEYYDGGWEATAESAKAYLFREARAAIAAMRDLDHEADAEMLIRGHAMVPELNPTQGDVRDAWGAMIDAALTAPG